MADIILAVLGDALLDILAAIREVVLIAAALSGMFIAWRGYSIWQKQQRAKIEHDAAEPILDAALQLRRSFLSARSPFMQGGEIDAALEHLKDALAEDKFKDFEGDGEKAAYQVRANELDKHFRTLAEHQIKAEVLFGSEFRDLHRGLWECRADWFVAVRRLLEARKRTPRERDLAKFEKIDKIVYDSSTPDKPDEFQQRIEAEIENIVTMLRPRLFTFEQPRFALKRDKS